ncbi:MAG: DUF2058 domain-containing protein [Gammaproteobacteria bacterium]|nr:DUF2058 domain-containing protein [Gammaproteobacteria bacterium]NND38699.1 DUF2058 domain-containing protein [Pseudomonadales bacterium]NNL11439.1 DUF2058 domain-containing protein [Pseudomonadales bacterium]RZV50466.1 MAG: DUF2058 domain-containing protein [Pseudomonadales bacterium]
MPSLQDQLLKAGMVDAKKAKALEKEKRRQAKQVRRGQAEADSDIEDAAAQAKAAKLEKDREANRQKQAQAEEKAITAQIKQLIESHRIARPGAGGGQGKEEPIGYQFVHGKKIKKILVDAKLQRQLECGVIAIVVLNDNYELVPAATAEKIAQRDSDIVVLLNDTIATAKDSGGDNSNDSDDDYYAQFKVPDDLMW